MEFFGMTQGELVLVLAIFFLVYGAAPLPKFGARVGELFAGRER